MNLPEIASRAADIPAPVLVRPHSLGGIQALWRFPNGYGASVIDNALSRGIELAVIEWPGESLESFHLTYDTSITDDVLGYLDETGLIATLRLIRDLPTPVKRL